MPAAYVCRHEQSVTQENPRLLSIIAAAATSVAALEVVAFAHPAG